MITVYIGVGSNINPMESIPRALSLLKKKVKISAVSTFYFTPPLNNKVQPDYCNGVWEIETSYSPHSLKFQVLRPIESELGRKRGQDTYASRTIDLDILVYGREVIRTDELTIPDPDIYTRPFIAIPLAEIAPHLIIPDTGEGINDIANTMKNTQMMPEHQIKDILYSIF
jgi:2-amino-4-hydroxy-6-hydroxymethyldihydropteridine diphosphokinase